ncbi:MAG: glycosyltransferase family 2 protein [Anaerolineae bacterium]
MTLDLSVCIATWNARELTLACLRSLTRWTSGITYEVILVDNGSSDGTLAAVEVEFPHIRTIRNPANEGFVYANNQALRSAAGRYTILLNNDMVFESDALSQMVLFMDGHPGVGVLGCRLRYPDGTAQHTAHEDQTWQDYFYAALFLHRLLPRSRRFGRINSTWLDYEADDLAVPTGWVAGAALMVRTSQLSEVGLLDERLFAFSEDWEWCRRHAAHGNEVVFYTGAEIVHLHGMSSARYVGPRSSEVRRRTILRMAAGAQYVYRKLHPHASLDTALFDASFRLFCLSRVVALGLGSLLRLCRADRGTLEGYLISVLMSYGSLRKHYLRA